MGSPATTGVTGFQFITSINSIDRDDETRRKVRSHARRQKLPSEPSRQSAVKSSSQKDRTSKFRLGARVSKKQQTQQTQDQCKSHSPTKSSSSPQDSQLIPSPISDGTQETQVQKRPALQTEIISDDLTFTVATELPTFPALPIRTTPLTENLFKWMVCVCLSPQEKFVQRWFDRCGAPSYFNTYHSSFLALSHSMNTQGNYFEFITVDPAMTHGFMGVVAAMHNALADWDDMTSIDFHRYETIKFINKRLNMEGRDDARVSDGVIVAVSLLVQIEAFIGSLISARAHMMGLKKMVDMRGGLVEGFGHVALLQRALSWADFAYATASQTPLSFQFIPKLATSLGIQDRFLSRSMMLNATPTSPAGPTLTIRSREVIEILELLYSTTQAINGFAFDKLEELKAERGQMSDSVYLIEYRLCNLEELVRRQERDRIKSQTTMGYSTPPSDHDQGPAPMSITNLGDLSNALVFASHLFLHMALRAQPPQAKAHRLPLDALMVSLYDVLGPLGLLPDPVSPSVFQTTNHSPDVPLSAATTSDNWSSPINDSTPSSEGTTGIYTTGDENYGARDELYEDILLWVLFVGSCVQPQRQTTWSPHEPTYDRRAFFLNALRKHCIRRSMLNRQVLLQRLQSLIWLDSWCEKQLEMIWARIGDELGL